jgi:hypothetical protein
MGSLSLTKSLSFVCEPKDLQLLSWGEVTYCLKVPSQALEGKHPKRISKGERPVHLVGLDLIPGKAYFESI